MVVSSNRQADRKPSLRHPHYLAVAPAPGSFLSVVRSGERLRWQHPRALFGAGADGHPKAPDRRPLGACPYRRQCAECLPPRFISGLSQTVMGADVFLDRLRGAAPGSSGTDSLLTDRPSPLAQLGKTSGIAEEHSPTWHLLADEGRYASLNWEVFHSAPRYLGDAG